MRSSDLYHQDFLDIIARITHIPRVYIGLRDAIGRACFAEKMSWASRRETSRPEDMAYCLLGLLDVNIPLLYGEGAQKAFLRLQQQFIQQSDDESIFAWNDYSGSLGSPWGILASSPLNFRESGQIRTISAADGMYTPRPPYTITNKGLSFETVAYSLHQDDNTNVTEPEDHGVPRIIIDRELPPGPVYAVPLNCRTTLNTVQQHGRMLCVLKGPGRLMAPREQNSRIAYAGDTCWIFLREHEPGLAVGESSDYFDDPDSSLVLGFQGEKEQIPKRLFVKLQSAAPRIVKTDLIEEESSSQDFKDDVERVRERIRRIEAHGTRFQVTSAMDRDTRIVKPDLVQQGSSSQNVQDDLERVKETVRRLEAQTIGFQVASTTIRDSAQT